jgi:uncharacterized protein (DUF3820 family)
MPRRRFKQSRKNVLASFTLSFGKYHGKPLSAVPRDYLEWMVAAPRIPVGDLWAAKQFLSLSSRRPTYDPAAVNRCVNDVKGAEAQAPEVSIGKPAMARTLCSTLPLDGKEGTLLAGIVPTESSKDARELPQAALASSVSG